MSNEEANCVQLRKRSNNDSVERREPSEKPAEAASKPAPAPGELHLVLLGKTGVGKSATGNSILGKTRFDDGLSMSSVTDECKRERATVEERELVLIDTPDFSVTDQALRKLKDCLALSSPGPHAFILVVPIGRFAEEQQRTVDMILEMFHEDIAHHTILVFSHADKLRGESIEEFISRQDQKVQKLVERFGRRFVAFDNTDPTNPDQLSRLLQTADEMLACNHNRHVTSRVSEEAERILQEKRQADVADRKRRIRSDVRRLANARIAALGASVNEQRRDAETRRSRTRSRIDQMEDDVKKEEQNVRPIPARLQRFRASLRREKEALRRLEEREKEEENERSERAEREKRDLEIWRSEEEQRLREHGGLAEDEHKKNMHWMHVFLLGLPVGLLVGFVLALLWFNFALLLQKSEDAQNSWFYK